MRGSRSVRVAVLALVGLAMVAAQPAGSHAAESMPPRSLFWIQRTIPSFQPVQVNDYLVSPKMVLTEDDAHRQVNVAVNDPWEPNHHYISMAASLGDVLDVGTYEVAGHGGPGMTLTGDCPTPETFRVDELIREAGSIVTLAAELTCGNGRDRARAVIRYNSTLPVTAHGWSAVRFDFPTTVAGTASAPRTIQITNIGDLPLTLGRAGFAGINGLEFEVTDDGCEGVTLGVSASCRVAFRFTPVDSTTFTRSAYLVIPDDSEMDMTVVLVTGPVLRVVTTSIVSSANPGTFETPPRFTATMTPVPEGGLVAWFVDGVEVQRLWWVPQAPQATHYQMNSGMGFGTHIVTAQYLGNDHYAASTSNAISQVVFAVTDTWLGARWIEGTDTFTVAATNRFTGAPGGLPGGELQILDLTTNSILATASVTTDGGSVETTLSFDGVHELKAVSTGLPPDIEGSFATAQAGVPIRADDLVVDDIPAGTVYTARVHAHHASPGIASLQIWITDPDHGSFSTGETACSPEGAGTGCWTDFVYRPQPGYVGPVHWAYRPTDAAGFYDWASITLTYRPAVIPDDEPPGGGVSINADAAWTREQAVTVEVIASDVGSAVDTVALSDDGSTWTLRPYAPIQAWSLPPGDGTKVVYAKWRDAAGNWSELGMDTIALDTSGPEVTGVSWRFVAADTVSSSGLVPLRFEWTGSDTASGIAEYAVELSTDGAAFSPLVPSMSSASLDRRLAPGHTYGVRVRAEDRAGNVGSWAAGPTFRLSSAQQSSTKVHYSGTWRSASAASHWGGSDRYSVRAGAKATFTFTGRAFAWVASTGPSRGSAKVYVNGVHVKTLSLSASKGTSRRVVFAQSWSTSAKRTVVVRVVGTSGHPRVDIDGFAWAS